MQSIGFGVEIRANPFFLYVSHKAVHADFVPCRSSPWPIRQCCVADPDPKPWPKWMLESCRCGSAINETAGTAPILVTTSPAFLPRFITGDIANRYSQLMTALDA